MILYPAIDLKDGDVVRLAKGEMDQATVFGSDPGAQARTFAEAGAEWIHVVDLNGAFAGETGQCGSRAFDFAGRGCASATRRWYPHA